VDCLTGSGGSARNRQNEELAALKLYRYGRRIAGSRCVCQFCRRMMLLNAPHAHVYTGAHRNENHEPDRQSLRNRVVSCDGLPITLARDDLNRRDRRRGILVELVNGLDPNNVWIQTRSQSLADLIRPHRKALAVALATVLGETNDSLHHHEPGQTTLPVGVAALRAQTADEAVYTHAPGHTSQVMLPSDVMALILARVLSSTRW
jgi:hypothetical protein